MNTPVKIGGFAVALAAVFALALGAGNALGPVVAEDPSAQDGHPSGHSAAQGEAAASGGHSGHGEAHHGEGPDPAWVDDLPGGVMISQHGYTLALDDFTLASGDDVPVTFQVRGPNREPITDFQQTHNKDLHFIAVRRDMTGFQHVHPSRTDGGNWRTALDLAPGMWRLFADFRPVDHGQDVTLGADAFVPGDFDPRPLPDPSRTARVGDYTVTLDGALVADESSRLTLSVSRDGQPVTDLQPYLAAYGHLVALRSDDLAYLHVHPDGAPGDGTTEAGPQITFYATAPSAAAYRLFLDFKHQGRVRTAEFTIRAAGGTGGGSDEQQGGGHGDH